jgi:hypothetical protein
MLERSFNTNERPIPVAASAKEVPMRANIQTLHPRSQAYIRDLRQALERMGRSFSSLHQNFTRVSENARRLAQSRRAA